MKRWAACDTCDNDNEPYFPEDGDAVIDQFGNNADAYLRRGTNYSEALAHQIATMSCS